MYSIAFAMKAVSISPTLTRKYILTSFVVIYALVQREACIVQLVDLIGVLDVVAYLVIYDTCRGDESADGHGSGLCE